MKVWTSDYQLKREDQSGSKPGFLVRIQDSHFEFGYSDCFPWPEFGDPSIGDLKSLIKDGKTCPLIEKTLAFAKRDGLAREKNQFLFPKDHQIRNHYLFVKIPSISEVKDKLSEGFQCFKIKCGKKSSEEMKFIKEISESISRPIKLRLDFNGKMKQEWIEFLNSYSEIIDYVEDPVSDLKTWEEWKLLSKFDFAYDQANFNPPEELCDYQIIKPAKQSLSDYRLRKIIFSSYMDHPVGQAFAALESLEYGEQTRDYGLMSQFVYQKNQFVDYFDCHENFFKVVGEKGIGFDDLWKEQVWKMLR